MHEGEYCFNKTVSLLALVLGEIGVMRDITRACVQPLLTVRPSHASVPKEQSTVFWQGFFQIMKSTQIWMWKLDSFPTWMYKLAMLLAVSGRKPDLQWLKPIGLLFEHAKKSAVRCLLAFVQWVGGVLLCLSHLKVAESVWELQIQCLVQGR